MKPKRRILAVTACALCLGACVAAPTPALAEGPIAESATELVFAGDTAQTVAGQLGVPVRCLGPSASFCSGTLTLSSAGHHSTAPFSVPGGSHEVLYVPLPLGTGATKVRGVATTVQRPGPPRSIQSYLQVD